MLSIYLNSVSKATCFPLRMIPRVGNLGTSHSSLKNDPTFLIKKRKRKQESLFLMHLALFHCCIPDQKLLFLVCLNGRLFSSQKG